MSPNKLSSCKMLLITEIKEVTSIKLVLRSTAVRNLTMWGGLFISWFFFFCDCYCPFIMWFIKLLLYMLRIWEMPTRKVLECCKQSVKDDLVAVQKIKVPEEKQKLETWFMKLQKGTKFLQGSKQKATFVIFWKKKDICAWSNERLICLVEKISKQKSIVALAWLLLTTVIKIYNKKEELSHNMC